MNFIWGKDKIPMSYQEQLIQHDYCDNCFSQFTCNNCSYYSFPCLNCELYGHICSLNCEPLPVYSGPRLKYPPGLPLPPVYIVNDNLVLDSLFDTADTVLDTDSEFDTEFDTDTNKCDHCLEYDLICMYECKNSCDNCLQNDLICNNDNDHIKKVLPKGKTYKQVFNEELNKNECCECGDKNNIVDWIYNDTDNIYELKNACENCLECGILLNEDNDNE
jgi:hypothetical protein